MSSAKVANIIKQNSKDKIINFILKSAHRFRSIKDFNSKEGAPISMEKPKSNFNTSVISNESPKPT